MWDFNNSLLVKMGILHKEGRYRCPTIISTHWSFWVMYMKYPFNRGSNKWQQIRQGRKVGPGQGEAKFKEVCTCTSWKVSISLNFELRHLTLLTLAWALQKRWTISPHACRRILSTKPQNSFLLLYYDTL